MKKIKTFIFMLFSLLVCTLSFACTQKPKQILVESILLNAEEIVLRPNEIFDLEVTVLPENSENNSIKYILTDSNVVNILVNPEDNTKAQIIAKSNIVGPNSTFLQVITEDETIRSKTCKITVLTDKIKLTAPQNIYYDNLSQEIVWDKVESCIGYQAKILIEGEEAVETEILATNSFKIDDYTDKIIAVEVKCIGDGAIYLDSEYSNTSFKFLQMQEPKNLKNDGLFVKFDKVENALSYNIFVYENRITDNPTYSKNILDAEFDESVGVKINELNTEGKTYFIKVQANPIEREDVQTYSSKCENYIKIEKFTTPTVSNNNFKFNYSNKTLSWKSIPYATGYVITRTFEDTKKIYNLNSFENFLELDTSDDKLVGGVYSYTLKVVGNETEYLSSNESGEISIEKLKAPTFYVDDNKIAWNQIENAGGYNFKIDDGNFTTFNKDTTYHLMNERYSAKDYSFVIQAIGDGKNTITSDLSAIFTATKLDVPSKAVLNSNQYLKISTNNYVDSLKVFLTYNNSTPSSFVINDLTDDTINEVKYTVFDMTSEDYDGGNYSVYARNYKQGYFTSEQSEIYEFSKLANTNNARIIDGELSFDLVEDANIAKMYLNGSEVIYNDNSFYLKENNDLIEIIPLQDYNLSFRYYPQLSNANIVISNFSENFTFQKLPMLESLYVENGEILFPESITMLNFFKKFQIKIGENLVSEVNNLSQIKLDDDTIYTIRAYYFGGTTFLSSEYSNSIKVQLIKNIDDFKLNGTDFTFSSVDKANSYQAVIIVNEEDNKATISKDLGIETGFNLKDIVKEKLNDIYNSLNNPLEFYVTCQGGNLQEASSEIVVGVNRENYAKVDSVNKSNSIKAKILPSPSFMMASNLYTSLKSYDINELYFYCNNNATLFNLKYNSSNKLISPGNGISLVGNLENDINSYVYKIDTSFLPAGTYDFEISAVSQFKVESNGSEELIYNIDSFESYKITNTIKLSSINSLSINHDGERDKVVINDSDTNYAYILTINGKTIYEDILGDNANLTDIVSEKVNSNDITGIINILKQFKSKERNIPSKYTGTFNINCYKIALPDLSSEINFLLNIESGGKALRSNLLNNPFEVTRLNAPKVNILNGNIEWLPVVDAEKYIIYYTTTEDNQTVVDYSNKLAELSAGTNSFDVYNYLNGTAGEYEYFLLTTTTASNKLSSNKSSLISFKILDIPTLKTEDGELRWDSIEDSDGYYLEMYSGSTKLDSFVFNKTTFSYDVMKTSKNKVIEGGEYTFKIQALGAISGDTTNIMTSLISSEFSATKLNTPNVAYVNNGKVNLTSVSDSGVDYYGLFINGQEVKIATSSLVVELNSSYIAGQYEFSYYAKGKNNYLTSNTSNILTAEKLRTTDRIYVANGSLYFDGVSYDGYTSKYQIDIKKESVISEEIQYTTSINFANVNSDIYTVEVRCLGDDNYYLNSDAKVMNNIIKLGNVSNFKIKDGKLAWDNPNRLSGLGANASISPNGMIITFKNKGTGKTTRYTLNNLEQCYELDSKFKAGEYYVEMQNIGDETNSLSEFTYINGDIVKYSKQIGTSTINVIEKLTQLTNLNIKDGINLKWTDNNTYNSVKKYIVYINHIVDGQTNRYQGILSSDNDSIVFDNIYYYINDDDENKLVLSTDGNIITKNGNLYYLDNEKEYPVNKFSSEGSFVVSVKAYGDDVYITSEVSDSITIVKPAPVSNLKVTHGQITWTGNEQANGYILTISRTNLLGNIDSDDLEYNNTHQVIYVNGQNYYNLTTVQKIYTISVRAYSLLSEDGGQTMASDSVTITNTFDSFDEGSGTDESPYKVKTENQILYMQYNNFATYEISNDIDLTQHFESLFTPSYPFIGKIIGNNKTISNLTITNLKNNSLYTGLLGYMDKQNITDDRVINGVRTVVETEFTATVSNLIISNVNITVGCNVGALAGYNAGTIYNVTVNGELKSTSYELADAGASIRSIYTGGIVGVNYGTIEKSNSYVVISPSQEAGSYSGGICAENYGTIYQVVVSETLQGVVVGGVTASNYGKVEGAKVHSTIWCYNFISDKGNLVAVAGGVSAINYQDGTILNCFVENDGYGQVNEGIINNSTSNIIGNRVFIGGLVGDNRGQCANNVVKTELYNLNENVSCVMGKLIGFNYNNGLKHNYCLSETQGQATNIIGDGQSVDSTNKEISTFNNETMVSTLNNNTYSNEKLVWQLIIISEEVKDLDLVMSD